MRVLRQSSSCAMARARARRSLLRPWVPAAKVLPGMCVSFWTPRAAGAGSSRLQELHRLEDLDMPDPQIPMHQNEHVVADHEPDDACQNRAGRGLRPEHGAD